MVTVTVAFCTAIVLWRGAALILCGLDDGWRVDGLSCVSDKFFKPVKDLATTTNAIAQAAVGVERIRAILETDTMIPETPEGLEPETLRARSNSSTSPLVMIRCPDPAGSSVSKSSQASLSASWGLRGAANRRSSA